MQDRLNVYSKVDEAIMMTSALYRRMKAGHCQIGETKLKCAVDQIWLKYVPVSETCDFVFPGPTEIFHQKTLWE